VLAFQQMLVGYWNERLSSDIWPKKFNQKVVMTLDALDCKATVYGMNATDVQQGLHAVTECAFERKLKIENHWQSLVQAAS
jgi:hypothetical protein